MCCFSGPVEMVSQTRIFARGIDNRQFLVYSMAYRAQRELAMVLPLPTPPDSPLKNVRFINLKNYWNFFFDLYSAFLPSKHMVCFGSVAYGGGKSLPVQRVGQYVASFVPSLDDFSRLDPQFRIADEIWNKLPAYHDFGFAVFQLKSNRHQTIVHPMAFVFQRRDPNRLYFPTFHIHQNDVPPHAYFDHQLYCQIDNELSQFTEGWQQSESKAGRSMSFWRSKGIIDRQKHLYTKSFEGRFENKDTILGKENAIPQPIPI